jgi:proliferating cell nuclear antigen
MASSSSPREKPSLVSRSARTEKGQVSLSTKRHPRLSSHMVDPINEPEVDPDHLIEVRTVNGTTLRNIIESLKNVLDEANFNFTEKGIRVTMADNHEICACLLTINASFFERYHCQSENQDRITMGINPREFHNCLKNVNASHTVTLILHKNNRGMLHVRLQNEDTGVEDEAWLVLRNLPSEHWVMDGNKQLEFTVDPPEIPSIELQRMFREFHSLHAKEVQITHIVRPEKDVVQFECIGGDIPKRTSITVYPAEGEEEARPEATQVSGRFLLYYLKQITNAATRISPKIRISLKQDNCMLLEFVLTGKDNRLQYLLFQVQND